MAIDWLLTLPAGTPYDRQVLAQTIRATITRWGSVRVAVGGALLLVDDAVAGAAEPCGRCGRPTDRLRCRLDGRTTCLRCALDPVAADADATLGVGERAPVAPRKTDAPHSGRRSRRGDAARPSIARHRQ